MKVKELVNKLNKIVEKGYGDTEVYFDTEAKSYDVHIVKIKSVDITKADIIDKNSYIILSGEVWWKRKIKELKIFIKLGGI